MECNVLGLNKEIIKKTCYKTRYKNVVICKLGNRCYSITHYQTGISIEYNRYASKTKALINLDNVVCNFREVLERNNIKSFKQYCKQKGIKQINF